ncbi:MAG TPA: type VI secretion system baseplate subunit TssK [Longimicrobium sp.]|nr:type VI secretion system baseplate subunit TssK [Longimicrobium sp.]
MHEIPEAVLWEEGMLLSPQHFQQGAQRQEELLHYHLGLDTPYHWGIVRLGWDKSQLAGKILRVHTLEAVMPDGLAVHHYADETLQVDLSLHEATARIDPVRVWLTVPARRGPGEPWNGSNHRTAPTDGDRAIDEYSGAQINVRRARPVLRLVAGPRPGNEYVSLPVAEVRVVEEAFTVSGSYVPPLLRCSTGSDPYRRCSELAQKTRNRANDLSQRGVGSEAVQRSIRAMAAALPPFEAVIKSARAHPFMLYHALCTFAGSLAGAGAPVVPPDFDAYDHENLGASFARVEEFASGLLKSMAETRQTHRFQLYRGGFRLPVLAEEWLRPDGLVIGVLAAEGSTEDAVVAWMDEVTIGSEERLADIRITRVKGAERTRVTNTARLKMTPGRREVLFRIKADAATVIPGKALVITHPGDPAGDRRPAAAHLYTV